MEIKFTVPVRPATKKNTPTIIWKKTTTPYCIKFGKFIAHKLFYRPLIISSFNNKEFEKDCIPILQKVKEQTGTINFPINRKCVFYTASMRRIDLTNLEEAIDDAMVKAGLLLDDNRDIIAGHDGSRVFYDKYNPRLEIELTEMIDYVQWKDTQTEQRSLEL